MGNDAPARGASEREVLDELVIQQRLRLMTVIVQGAAVLVLALSFVELDVTTSDDRTVVRPALDWLRRGWVVLALVPSLWVMRAPRRRPILAFAGWYVATMIAFGAFAGVDAQQPWAAEWVHPWWVQSLIALLLVGASGVVIFVMPLARLLSPEPAGPPVARVHRRR